MMNHRFKLKTSLFLMNNFEKIMSSRTKDLPSKSHKLIEKKETLTGLANEIWFKKIFYRVNLNKMPNKVKVIDHNQIKIS